MWFAAAGLLAAAPLWAEALGARDYGSARVLAVVSVYDGDTFRANVEGWPPIVGSSMAIRIAGIDTPELRDPNPEVRALARIARAFTTARLRGASTIELRHIRRGKYFRLVADVMVDGESVGRALLEADLAKPYDGGRRPPWP